jgi:copper transport protein
MRAFALALLVALAFPAVASAHATLRSTTPPFGTELQRGPATIRLHFDQSVTLLPGAVRVLNGVGKDFAGPARVEGTEVVATVRPLKLGAYTIRWRAVSADSHVVSGVWTFGVRVPAPAVTEAYGAGGPTIQEHIVRWLWFLGLALTIGALGLRLIVLRGLAIPRALERKIAVVAGAGTVVALQAGIGAFSLRSEDALQLPFGRFLYGDLSPMAQTRFGRAFVAMTLAFALVLALVYLAWLLDRVEPLVPAFAIALVFVGGLSVSGHDAVDPGSSWKTELADWVHIGAASLWIGGLATMAGLVWFGAPELRRTMFTRFSQMATVSIALVLGAGTYLAIVRLPHLHDLWSTGYGRVLLVKLGLVNFALLWGAFHKFVVLPALQRADVGFLTRIGRSLLGESLVGASVLLVAAILVDSKPPPRPQPKTPTAVSPAALGGDGPSRAQSAHPRVE